ncbi:MAG: aconitate hydratase AcnA [Polyangiaceae bacterium]|jgi:aconitate hydratase
MLDLCAAAKSSLTVGERSYTIFRLAPVYSAFPGSERLPNSLKILLENVLRVASADPARRQDVEAVASIDLAAPASREIAFSPARVLLQDFTGVPALADLAAMRDAMTALGGDPLRIEPLQPVDLVVDHSVQVDRFGTSDALRINAQLELHRNKERYRFLKWGQGAFRTFRVVPPDTGIVHQVNLEHLGRVVMTSDDGKSAYPDTLVGTDSHTTMINGLGVLGWGVGGIEAEAAMLGQPVSMLVPQVVGFKLVGRLREGATATDLVLTVTELLRKHGVVGKFVEFFGEGVSALTLADRATLANMAPEYGATCGLFPVDDETLRYLRATGRSADHVRLVEAYFKEQGLFGVPGAPDARFSEVVTLDLADVEPCVAGPRRPQDRVRLTDVQGSFRSALATFGVGSPASKSVRATLEGEDVDLSHGAVVIAAITSCTNTSNPGVLIAAGLLAKKAVEKGLSSKPWVKTSLAPGSQVVTEYLGKAGLTPFLEKLGFHTVGYGCTTCIGNSGPLPVGVSNAIERGSLVVASVLSGNRNFEGRVHAEVRANYLASPPLVVAYALAGTVDYDPANDPLGKAADGTSIYLKDIWPTSEEIQGVLQANVDPSMFDRVYARVFEGDASWRNLPAATGESYAWDPDSTYVKRPPFFDGMSREPPAVTDIVDARVLAMLGDSITTDHISPAGAIKKTSPAAAYLAAHGVIPEDFNSYGARRGNHDVMVRGTFANVRLRNLLAPGTEGGVTRYLGTRGAAPAADPVMTIFDAAVRYAADGVALLVLAGKEYGSGSSRDWAAKGPKLLGVRAVLAESFERIHRSNLVGMGILPLQFARGESASVLELTGEEAYTIRDIATAIVHRKVSVVAARPDGSEIEFVTIVRVDTPEERAYYRHGGILPYVLRQLIAKPGQ